MTPEKKTTVVVTTTLNVPYRDWLDENAIADALNTGDIKKGQVGSFFTEISVEDQKAFARINGVSEENLIATAKAFAEWSGQDPPLLG